MPFTLASTAFADGAAIPLTHTCDGENIPPSLSWRNPPPGTRSFVLLLHDPDSRFGDFPHWVVYDISADRREIDGGTAGGIVGTNGFGTRDYGGPCPQPGEHRYVFDLYALSLDTLGLGSGADAEAVEAAMEGHLLSRACLTGRYERPKPSQV